ncbi:MAG: hypothetical protein AAGL69_11550 [Pseudomonadota bacterium]
MHSPYRIAQIIVGLVTLSFAGCGADSPQITAKPQTLDQLARDYLVLELAMGQVDPAHVDAYFGPGELAEQARLNGWTLVQIDREAAKLTASLQSARNESNALRIDGLVGRIAALRMRHRILSGQKPDFDEESEALFGAVAPDRDAAYYDAVLEEIDTLLPGEATLAERVDVFRQQFTIPPDKLDAVFRAAMAECRARTLQRIELPANERFQIEYVSDKPWSGYNWYKGDSESLIQFNTDLPTSIDRAVDLGCHEGYPGHHTFNALVEQELVNKRGWIEYALYPLFSPQSLVAEGTGNYGIQLAFPAADRVSFEREVLFPLAGLDVGEADRYYALLDRLSALNFAGNEAARDFLNGDISKQEAIDWLQRYSLSSRARAEQRLHFIETYRSYVINYNLGQALVAEWVSADGASQEQRWRKFSELLIQPVVPGSLGRSLAETT